jgi:nitroreductase
VNEVFDAVRTVLAVRTYKDDRVPEDVLGRIVEAAHLSASARNDQPWHFVVVQDVGMLRDLAVIAKSGRYLEHAAVAVVVAIERTAFAVSDASRAIQSMVLTAWAEGVGSNWVGFLGGLDDVKPLLGIPDELDVLSIVPFGYPADSIGAGRKKREPLGDVVHRERFGTPFA